MSEVPNFKCKTCGALLDDLVAQSLNGLVECPYCQNKWTIPKKETSPAALSFLRMGEHDLDTCKFEDALAAYKKAADLDPSEPEAYFGMALAEFKVQYLKDHVNNRLQPICHEVTEKIFTECNAYLRALLKATPEQKAEYEKKGAEIDYILKEFFKLKESGLNYDCFLCVKVTDNGTTTEDSKDADYIYGLLQRKGYKPFYSERELRNVTGADYEARILYALMTSECMLVICRNEGYLETPWVKNEYTRFLKLVNDEEKESDSITIVFNGTPIERLPGRSGKLQGIDFSRREADGKIVDFVEKHTPEAKARREEEEKRRAERDEETARRFEETSKRFSALEEQLRNSSKPVRGMTTSTDTLMKRGYQELEDRHVKEAGEFFDRVLEAEPEDPEAWWGKTLCELSTDLAGKLIPSRSKDVSVPSLDLKDCEVLNYSQNLTHVMRYVGESAFEDTFNPIRQGLLDSLGTLEAGKETRYQQEYSKLNEIKNEYENNPKKLKTEKELDGLEKKLAEQKKEHSLLISRSEEAERKAESFENVYGVALKKRSVGLLWLFIIGAVGAIALGVAIVTKYVFGIIFAVGCFIVLFVLIIIKCVRKQRRKEGEALRENMASAHNEVHSIEEQIESTIKQINSKYGTLNSLKQNYKNQTQKQTDKLEGLKNELELLRNVAVRFKEQR